MRSPLKCLAALILLPFLACTDTPAEPKAESTTEIRSSRRTQPRDPPLGEWIYMTLECKKNTGAVFAAGTTDYGMELSCDNEYPTYYLYFPLGYRYYDAFTYLETWSPKNDRTSTLCPTTWTLIEWHDFYTGATFVRNCVGQAIGTVRYMRVEPYNCVIEACDTCH